MKNKSLRLNFVMNAILTMSSFIFPLITFPYISRILLPAGTGKVSFATSFVSYFTMFSQLGIPIYGIRACAKIRDDKEELTRTAHELLFLNLIMCVLSYVCLGLMLVFIPRLQEDRALFLIVSSTIFLNAIGMEWLYKALEQYTYITVRSIMFKFIALIAMFALIHKQEDYIIYGAISIFASSASNIFNLINVRKYIAVKWIGEYNLMRHLKFIIVFFAMSCATTIYTHLDTVMLGFMATDVDVGYYNAAVKIKSILVSIVTSLGTVMLPRASYYVQYELFDEFDSIIKKALNFIFVAASPLMIYFVVFAKEGIFFLSGAAFQGSVIPMQVIMPTLLFIGVSNVLGIQILVPLGKEKIVLYSEIVGAVTDVILNAVLIPKFASTGAAIGTLVAEAVVLMVQIIALKDRMIDFIGKIQFGKIMTSLIAPVLILLWVKRLNLSLFSSLLISGSLFMGTYAITLVVAKEPLVTELFHQLLDQAKKPRNRQR